MVSDNTSGKKVLVVDDEEIVRDSCWRVLTDAGYTVRTVSNGRDALRACRSEAIDVVLTDVRMPDMDGIQVARTIRQEFPEVRVLIITGYPSRKSAEQAEKLGIFDYLEKPLVPSRLNAATAAALASPPRRLPDELFAAATRTNETVDSSAVARATPDGRTEVPQNAASSAAVVETPEGTAAPRGAPVSEEAPAKRSPLKTLTLMALSPLLGLALVVFLPVLGFGMLFLALGSGLLGKRRSAQA